MIYNNNNQKRVFNYWYSKK